MISIELTNKIEELVIFTNSFKDQNNMTKDDLNKSYDMLVDIEDCMSRIIFKPTAVFELMDMQRQIIDIKNDISKLLNQ
ncbi:hypothetical protein A2Z67_02410 [Candidatus Woesebacteria bacterium RBG_13_36_22]|uniref:Uncharacterized protein n=1 Tax=Candidatus Woesebacteria bacterium RBG_13_36_22 TaxID=1802478 RepID=A0A1F7X1I9_9BACT|nr:MAG: hypothetical protein A2Z67_02410 [Candidatus Woesebacteria bacterium RBG_13_36_22]